MSDAIMRAESLLCKGAEAFSARGAGPLMTVPQLVRAGRAIVACRLPEDVEADVLVLLATAADPTRALPRPRAESSASERQRRYRMRRHANIYERDGFRCRYCGSDVRALAIDHVVPRVQGGTDFPVNLVVACKSCNSRKGGRTPEQAGMTLRAIRS
jgi:DNA-directed RNA polymerase subunit RPC12/RpoP